LEAELLQEGRILVPALFAETLPHPEGETVVVGTQGSGELSLKGEVGGEDVEAAEVQMALGRARS
jgi:hypothetical protein